eukprot:Polyplicarium_translucidae@DN1663_c0_g1_i2.p3
MDLKDLWDPNQPPAKAPRHQPEVSKPNEAPAVPLPGSGQSFNPNADSRYELVMDEAEPEAKMEMKRRLWTTKQEPITTLLEAHLPAEIISGLPERTKQHVFLFLRSHPPGSACPPDPASIVRAARQWRREVRAKADADAEEPAPATKVPKRKTTQQRRRFALHQIREREIQKRKARVRFNTSLERYRDAVAELDAIADRTKERRSIRKEEEAAAKDAERRGDRVSVRTGKGRFETAPKEVLLSEDLQPGRSLRALRVASAGAVRDRAASILRRGLIAIPRKFTAADVRRARNWKARVTRRRLLKPAGSKGDFL